MNNKYEAVGTIHAVMKTHEISDTFRKREFVLEIPDGNYSQTVKFQLVQDKTSLLDDFKVGDRVRISFNLKGRAYTRKSDGSTDYFVNLDCWRIAAAEGDEAPFEDQSGYGNPSGPSAGSDFGDVPF